MLRVAKLHGKGSVPDKFCIQEISTISSIEMFTNDCDVIILLNNNVDDEYGRSRQYFSRYIYVKQKYVNKQV